ncbi:PDR/VanB family oxidoreductase [Pseudomonas cremoricolorata]|uniref:Vanillate O-demethylase oxidoreductase n=1 Tax=Pseudomonas cremoricolorata TaxID=157783 RepID=A0A089WN47_9PSED|nr:PDR/VanB family oxidoreductase [Pseudomonas cremoricolorata]AIR90680.1 Vanillate O-demethylase oxidoreductase [Pseudomonas cremoricolorata]
MNDALLDVIVQTREVQGADVAVLELAALDGQALPRFAAGAHVDVHLAPGVVRQYSLCGDPARANVYRLGVLREAQSRGGSAAVHVQLQAGALTRISAPRNLFPLVADAQRSILLGGGIGITPLIAMAHTLHARGEAFELHYRARSRSRCAFVDELLAAPFAASVFTHFSDEGDDQRLDLAQVLGDPAPGTHLYTCGPTGFMDWVIAGARAQGFSAEQIHHEYFQVEVDSAGAGFEVQAVRSGKTLQVAPEQSLLAALREAGIAVEVSCEQGVCGTCLCDVLEGEPDHRDHYLTDEEKQSNEQIVVCCSRARSARLVLDI